MILDSLLLLRIFSLDFLYAELALSPCLVSVNTQSVYIFFSTCGYRISSKLKPSASAFSFLNSPPARPLTDSPESASAGLTPAQQSVNTTAEQFSFRLLVPDLGNEKFGLGYPQLK